MTGSVHSAQSFPGLVLLGIAVLSSLHLFYRDRPPGEDLLHLMMTVIGRVMIVTAFVEASFLFLSFLAIPFGIVVFCILLYVAFRYWLRRRVSLLAIMAAASRRWMPLAPAARALGHEWRGTFGKRCRRVADAIEAGMPLGEALRLHGPAIPRRELALVEVGVCTGNISGALAEAARSPAAQLTMGRVWAAVWYLGGIALTGIIILTFFSVKIIPAFIKIFDDFDAELPPSTRLLIQSCDWFAGYGWPPLALGVFSVAIFAALWTSGVVTWLPPPLRGLSQRRDAVTVLRALALATEVNRPLEPALTALAEHHPSEPMRACLRQIREQMAQGQSWAEGLLRHGLLRRAELAVLTSAERAGNLTWALRDLAEAIERRFALRLQRWMEILVPAAILAAGAIVMFIVVSLFVPLISLITKLL